MKFFILVFAVLNLFYGITGENEVLKAINYIVAGIDVGYLLGTFITNIEYNK